jgi:iron(III) transport system substrate-binding protein
MKRFIGIVTTAGLSAVFMIVAILFAVALEAAEARPGWEAQWEKTVAAAKQEGQVVIYGNRSSADIVNSGGFQKAYPQIKVVAVSLGGAQAMQRLMAERRAGKYLADLFIGGSNTPVMMHRAESLDPIKPALILPEVLDESKWWEGKHRYIDPQREYIFMYLGHPQRGNVAFNSKLVDPKEFTSFWDFLNPKWKGKIEARDFRIGGAGQQNMRFFYYNPELGPRFIRRLFSEMDITLFRDTRQSIDWLATGRFAICFFCYDIDLLRAQKQGLPVDEFGYMREGVALTSQSGTLSLVHKAPNPNAARVFTNWFLSREGQLMAQKLQANSLRVDIPKDMLPPSDRLIEGTRYVEIETPDRMSMEPVTKVFEEALAEAKKK